MFKCSTKWQATRGALDDGYPLGNSALAWVADIAGVSNAVPTRHTYDLVTATPAPGTHNRHLPDLLGNVYFYRFFM